MKKAIYIIGAGIMQLPAIKTAKEMGLKTIVADYNPNAIGMKIADVPATMSTKDIEGNVRTAKQLNGYYQISGVITIGTDASMTVAAVASALGLPGLKYDVAERATNKIKMRGCFKKHKVPSPKHIGIWSFEEAIKNIKNLSFPVVIKPADNMGARGVKKLENISELKEAFNIAKQNSPSGDIIIEEYMDGPELSIDLLLYDSKIILAAIADRIIKYPPYFVEIGHNLPSAMSQKTINKALEVMMAGVKAIGIDNGAAKGDIKITKEGPKIGEIAARLSGGFMSSHTYPLATGNNIIKGAIELALGEKPYFPKNNPLQKVSIERAIIPQPGEIVEINNISKAKKIQGVQDIFIKVEPGNVLYSPKDNMDKAGNIIVTADSLEKAEKIANKALKTISINTKPPEKKLDHIYNQARRKLYNVCKVCKVCDGVLCAGSIPGMGAVGRGLTFINNVKKLSEINLKLKVIHNIKNPNTEIELFGFKFNTPIFAAPITGAITNFEGSITEYDYSYSVSRGCKKMNSLAFLGDGASAEKYKIIIKSAVDSKSRAACIFKPRSNKEIIKRIHSAEKKGIKIVGIDIDAVTLKTMKNKKIQTFSKNAEDLKYIKKSIKAKLLIKGIMSPDEAEICLNSGVDGIIVSNHGGRILDSLPATIEVLPEIVKKINKKIPILIDGGFRTGEDILKALAYGADACLIGRPIAIATIGGGSEGVNLILKNLNDELKKSMLLTGCKDLESISDNIIYKNY